MVVKFPEFPEFPDFRSNFVLSVPKLVEEKKNVNNENIVGRSITYNVCSRLPSPGVPALKKKRRTTIQF